MKYIVTLLYNKRGYTLVTIISVLSRCFQPSVFFPIRQRFSRIVETCPSLSVWTIAQSLPWQNPCLSCRGAVWSSQGITKSSPSEQHPRKTVPKRGSVYTFSSMQLNTERYYIQSTGTQRTNKLALTTLCLKVFLSVHLSLCPSGTETRQCGGKAVCVSGRRRQFIFPANSGGLTNTALPPHQEPQPPASTVGWYTVVVDIPVLSHCSVYCL